MFAASCIPLACDAEVGIMIGLLYVISGAKQERKKVKKKKKNC